MTSRSKEMETYLLIYLTETQAALGVALEEDGEIIWLPKSQIEYDEEGSYGRNDEIEVLVPEWLADERGL